MDFLKNFLFYILPGILFANFSSAVDIPKTQPRPTVEVTAGESLVIEPSTDSNNPTNTPIPSALPTSVLGTTVPDRFSPNGFVEIFHAADLPNLTAPISNVVITGDSAADAHIRQLAEARGFKAQRVAIDKLPSIDGQLMQAGAREDWVRLKGFALENGFRLGLISAYRSVDVQRSLFTSRFNQVAGKAYTPAQIAAGLADTALNATLDRTAAPGYSKHHTGYTIDITDLNSGKDFTLFGTTKAYEWLSADNFAHARKFGFIPSYPVGAENIGPQTEEWEYVWVGEDNLK
jgi:LAS superfamily LD-carboxypeptidase LdcB